MRKNVADWRSVTLHSCTLSFTYPPRFIRRLPLVSIVCRVDAAQWNGTECGVDLICALGEVGVAASMFLNLIPCHTFLWHFMRKCVCMCAVMAAFKVGLKRFHFRYIFVELNVSERAFNLFVFYCANNLEGFTSFCVCFFFVSEQTTMLVHICYEKY